jgi:ABC-type branched-subunit amino acid transport system permease subunit
MPKNWEDVFNSGLAFATIFLSITLITGMGGQLSLAQATLAGVGAFTAAQLALHLGLNMVLGMLVGAAVAAVTATVLALLSLRLKGLGLALMTLAAALFFDSSVFPIHGLTGGQAGINLEQSWVSPLTLFSASGHQFFILAFVVVVAAVVVVKLLQKGTVGQYLTAMRGSEPAASSLGINLTWQRVSIFAVSGAIAGVGGTLLTLNTQTANPDQFNYQLSLVFVVIVVTAGVSRVEGAIQGAMGFVVIEQLLTYAPPRFQGVTIVLFGAGALTYAAHPEGIVEYAKTRTARLWGAGVGPAPEKAHSEPSSGGVSTASPMTDTASRGVLLSGGDDYG